MFKLLSVMLAVFIVVDRLYRLVRNRNTRPLPPGPRHLPLIGNWFDMPKQYHHHGPFWAAHKDKYGQTSPPRWTDIRGSISSVSTFGQTIIIINDMKLADELLEKKSLIYSDRHVPTFGAKMCGLADNVIFLPYGERFRATRRLFRQFMGSHKLIAQYEPLEELEARRFLLGTLREPGKFRSHIRTMAGAVILKLAYGYEIRREGHDPLIEAVELAMSRFSISLQPGTWLVDVIPALQYLPTWIPGTEFKRIAEDWKAQYQSRVRAPYNYVKRQMGRAAECYIPSFTSRHLEAGNLTPYDEDVLMWAAGDLYSGGTDTTVSAISSFVLAMVSYPHVLRRAQQEIDEVIGRERLPNFDDRSSLPFVNAIIKETLRWNVVTPTGIPHVSSQDDTHDGYFIPKGSIVIPNIWQFSRDPDVYHEPCAFKPERFLGSENRKPEADPRSYAFGFGRRACPGQSLAESSLYITIAMSLAVFNFGKSLDINGNTINPLCDYTKGSISHPKDFSCSITPRDMKAALLINTITEELLPVSASELYGSNRN